MNEPVKVLQAEFVDPDEIRLDRIIQNGARACVGALEHQLSTKVGAPVDLWGRGLGSIVNTAIKEAGIKPVTPVGLARSLGLLGPEQPKVRAARRNR